MATSLYISEIAGTVTSSQIKLSVSFSVTFDGRYHTEFDLIHNGYVEHTYYGKEYQMSAGGSMSNLEKTIDGLEPLTEYTVRAYLCNSVTGDRLDVTQGNFTVIFTTDSAPAVATSYWAKVILDGNGGICDGSSTWTYDHWGPGWGDYAYVDVAFNDPGFQKSGSTLVGWSESRNASTIDYNKSGVISIKSTSTSQSNPTTVRLYAVWKKGRPEDWEWTSTVSKGSTLSLTALEWNDFISRIQEFATYRGVNLNSANISSGSATRGARMMASQANAVRSLIDQLNPRISVPSSVTSGTSTITAAFVNGLKTSLNSIP